MTKSQTEGYRLKLTGPGVTLDRDVSEEVAREILNLTMGGPARAPGLRVPGGSAAVDGATGRSAATTPKAFLAAKRPQTDVQRVTCLAYYLTHHRETPAFKTGDLTKLNTEAAQPKLSNPTVAVQNATAASYLSAAGQARKQITNHGESVVEALPDQAAVKQILENSPVRKRKKTKRRNKKN
jgi:hypothetical protein